MMYSIKARTYNNYYLFLVLGSAMLIFSECRDSHVFCHPEIKNWRNHQLVVPVEVSPVKEVYDIGDTLTFDYAAENPIYDRTVDTYHHIEKFPFRPTSILFRLDIAMDTTYSSGFRNNEVIVAEDYPFDYIFGDILTKADFIVSEMIFEDDRYHYRYQIVLKTSGTYLLLNLDQYNERDLASDIAGNMVADTVPFDGKCPGAPVNVAYELQNGYNVDEYRTEWEWLDMNVFFDELLVGKDQAPSPSSLRYGSHPRIDLSAPYAFRVVE